MRDSEALPLHTNLVARLPLLPADLERLSVPCTGLGGTLLAVLERLAEEAGLLVIHLPTADSEHLLTAALSLLHAQRLAPVSLPADIIRSLLLAAMAG